MFFDKIDDIFKLAIKNGCNVFVVPKNVKIDARDAIILEPVEKNVISIDQVRETISHINVRQVAERFVFVRPAELLGDIASNALLKSLEETKDKVHFILVVDELSSLLPTIISRSAVYFYRDQHKFDSVDADEKIKLFAKQLISAKPNELAALADEISKKKPDSRKYALGVLRVAIELLYKSYFLTKKSVFLKKLPKFLNAYDNISNNGHIKLHLVADLC